MSQYKNNLITIIILAFVSLSFTSPINTSNEVDSNFNATDALQLNDGNLAGFEAGMPTPAQLYGWADVLRYC